MPPLPFIYRYFAAASDTRFSPPLLRRFAAAMPDDIYQPA